ncbi:MAG: CDGSH iron-sulfur domain-containing protein [Nitrospinae bacterium]|nr:CDGSH iron-sulfur domain-containing protein [Nitrospinota bacterium]
MPEPKSPQKAPYVLDMEPGAYMWCGCGLSKNQPFCDNAHKGTEYQGTKIAAVLVDIDEAKTVAFCGCKHTKTPPFCDGTHKTLT